MLPRKLIRECFFFFVLLNTAFISSCTVGPTLIATRTPTSTPRPCPPIAIDTPDILGFRKTIIVVLMQPDPYYEYSAAALEVLDKIIPQVIEPNDAFYLLRTGIFVSNFDVALISNGEVLNASRPAIPSTPTFIPTITQTNTPIHTPQSAVGQQGATAQAEQTVSALYATATQSEFMHNCAMQEWEEEYHEQSVNWEATKTVIRKEFVKEFEEDIDSYKQQINVTPTALPNMVYESFVHTSLVFNNYNCGADDRCFLIIFSDLHDSRPSTPNNVKEKVALVGVKVISVMFNCDPIFEPSCKSIQDHWTENFASYNASLPPVYLNGDGLDKALLDILIRR